MTHTWPLIYVPGVLDKLTEKYRLAYSVFYWVVWQSSLSDSRRSKFGRNLASGSIEISDFGADVNSRAPLNYSFFTRQVQLGQSTISEGITHYLYHYYFLLLLLFFILFLFLFYFQFIPYIYLSPRVTTDVHLTLQIDTRTVPPQPRHITSTASSR